MSKIKEKENIILLRTESRLLPVKLNDVELRQSGDDLAATVQEINSEEDRQKNIKDQLKARMSELTSKQSRLALRISRKEEFREVPVLIEMHTSGQVSETRKDTGEVLIIREAKDYEKQLPLDKQTGEVITSGETQNVKETLPEKDKDLPL